MNSKPTNLDLPYDYSVPLVPSFIFETYSIELPENIRALNREIETVVLSAFIAYLYRHTYKKDIVLLYHEEYLLQCSVDEGMVFSEVLEMIEKSIQDRQQYDKKEASLQIAWGDLKSNLVDMSFELSLSGTISNLICRFNTERFTEKAIVLFLKQYLTFMQAWLKNQTLTIGEIDVYQPKMLVDEVKLDESSNVIDLFLEQVRRRPKVTAVCCKERTLNYEALDFYSRQLSHKLIGAGVEQQDLVAVYLDRDCDLLVSLLAILRSGAAYLPLDLSHPKERVEAIVNDANPSFILTTMDASASLSKTACPILYLEKLDEIRVNSSIEDRSIRASDVVYVIYTSGSTGQPKGIEVEHGSLFNFINSMKHTPGLAESDKLCAITTISFDIAALELFLPLCVGAEVVIATQAELMNPDEIAKLIEKHEISFMQATPITWKWLSDLGWKAPQGFTGLCGGEALTHELAKDLLVLGLDLYNMYGPTETTIWSTLHHVEWEDLYRDGHSMPIGKPIDSTQVYLLDENNRFVPEGSVGEIVIAGKGLARGYRNNEWENQTKFIERDINPGIKNRVYKTGDRARYLSDGTLLYLGRQDGQIKLRGHRIEVGEIEAALNRHNGIDQVIVILDKEVLQAYLVFKNEVLTRLSLRNYLKSILPDYMIPQRFFHVPSLPMTLNGKYDRKALRHLEVDDCVEQEGGFTPSESDLELEIMNLWSQELKLKTISATDNFFDLGAHSLVLYKVYQALKRQHAKLTLIDLYQYPNSRALSGFLKQKSNSQNIPDTGTQRAKKRLQHRHRFDKGER